MRLSDIFSADKPITDAAKSTAADPAKTAELNRQIKSLVPGQTISGEIVTKNGGEIQIKLLDNLLLNAKLEQNMNLEIGRNMTFEVRNNRKSLTLSPLFANMATDANAIKALDMAMLPINEDTVKMADAMMKAGMPVDKNSLQQMFRDVMNFKDADVLDIVDLHRLGLSVNEENVSQIESYKNFSHQILLGMSEVANELSDTLSSMAEKGDIELAGNIFSKLISFVTGESDNVQMQQLDANDIVNGQSTEKTIISEGVPKEGMVIINQENDELQPENIKPENLNSEDLKSENQGTQSLPEYLSNISKKPISSESTQILNTANEVITKALAEHDTTVLRDLFNNKEFKDLLKESLTERWTLKPEDVADKDKVEEFYHKLDRNLKELTQMLESGNQNNSGAYKAAANMSQNLDFMNQINNMAAYIQLPLKLSQGNAHGDLYVYTNKKNLAAKDGKVSALLHLDMEHLGPVDVYVALENSNVSTNFYLKDDAMLDFLSQHMDILTDRLKGRGYNCSVNMQIRGEKEENNTGVGPILKNGGNIAIAKYAFDVRA